MPRPQSEVGQVVGKEALALGTGATLAVSGAVAVGGSSGALMLAGGLALILHRALDYLKTPDGVNLVGRWMPVRFVPVLALGMGVIIGVVDSVLGGKSLLHAVLFGGIPMLAVFIDRLMGAVRRPEAKKQIEKLGDDELAARIERLAGEGERAANEKATRALAASKAIPDMVKP